VESSESPKTLRIVFPPKPVPGTLAVLVPHDCENELRALEETGGRIVWRVRAVLTDSIPLAGTLATVLGHPGHPLLFLHVDSPLTIYPHQGGDSVVFYDLVATPDGHVHHIEVDVESQTPNAALMYGRLAINQLLDAMLRATGTLPIVIQRLELASPSDDRTLAYETVLPSMTGIKLGPLGGIQSWPMFAPYLAVLREAETSSSPFYRLLCAYRVYEGTNLIRKTLNELKQKLNVGDRRPPDPEVNAVDLVERGMTEEFCKGVNYAKDLFDALRGHRDGVAHFLLEGDERSGHVYVSDSLTIRMYDVLSRVLLERVLPLRGVGHRGCPRAPLPDRAHGNVPTAAPRSVGGSAHAEAIRRLVEQPHVKRRVALRPSGAQARWPSREARSFASTDG